MNNMLRLVTLDYFYGATGEPLTWEYFGKVASLRYMGYGKDYPKNFLPLDAGDYIARHHLICIESQFGLQPVGGFRDLTLSKCDQYSIELPIIKLLRDGQAHDHLQVMQEWVQMCRTQKKDLLYSSGLTIKKEVRQDMNLSENIVELAVALLYEDFLGSGSILGITGAVPRFRTDRLFQQMGYAVLQDGKGRSLPTVAKVSAGGEPVLLMAFEQPSEYMRTHFEKHRALLEDRIWVGLQTNINQGTPKKAA